MTALASAKSACRPGKASRPHGPTQTAIEKPAQKRSAHEASSS